MGRRRDGSMAATADRHYLYQEAVQDPVAEIDFIEETWGELRRRPLELLREDFWKKFAKDLERAKTEMRDVKREAIPTDQSCDKCGKPMVLKWGRFGQFLACSGYPDCKNTRDVGGELGNSNGDRASMAAAAKAAKASKANS